MAETRTACPLCGGNGVVFQVEQIAGGYRGEVDGCPVCRGTGQVPVTITHGDAIRAMDDRALALWMLGLIEETDVPRYCRFLPECDRDLDEDEEIPWSGAGSAWRSGWDRPREEDRMGSRRDELIPVTVVTVRGELTVEGRRALWAQLAGEIMAGLVTLDDGMTLDVRHLPRPDPEHLLVEERPAPARPQEAGRCADEKRAILGRLQRYRSAHGLGCFAALAAASGGSLTTQTIRSLYIGEETYPIQVLRMVGEALGKCEETNPEREAGKHA